MRGYKKKKIEKSILLSVLAGALLLSTAAHAENVTYTGRGMFGTNPQDAWHGASVYSDTSWNDNTVTITGVIDTSKLYDVRGGTAKTYKPYNLDDTSGNTVIISDSTFGRRNTTSTNGVYGGQSSNDGAVNYNHVIITAKSNITAEYVEGGRSYGSGKVIGNDVLIDGGSTVTGGLFRSAGVVLCGGFRPGGAAVRGIFGRGMPGRLCRMCGIAVRGDTRHIGSGCKFL